MPGLEYHALVEFVNRLFTAVVAIAVAGAVLGSTRRIPRRRDLTQWSWGLVAGVIAQVGLGALLVRTELDPRFTMGHFLLSMVLLWNAVVLDHKARDARDVEAMTLDALTRSLLRVVLVTGAALLVTGTVVTGAGPHAGDTRAERLPFLVREATRVHSLVAIALLVIVGVAWYRLRSPGSRAENRLRGQLSRIAGLIVVQGAVGYTQYFTGVPAGLVGVHVALATVTWIAIAQASTAVGRPHREQPEVCEAAIPGLSTS